LAKEDQVATSTRLGPRVPIDNSTFTIERVAALSAGDINLAVRKRVAEILASNRKNVVAAFKEGLKELVDRGAISAAESQTLAKILRLLLDVTRDRTDAEDAFLDIRTTYHKMIADQRSSPVALAIAGVASSSFSLDKNSPLKVNKTAGAFGGGIGALVGAGIGVGIGGPIGGVIGGIIGGAVGATVGLCGSGKS
jgi:hypothetical protein